VVFGCEDCENQMHKIFNTLNSSMNRTEWRDPQQSQFSHGKQESTNNWLPTTMNGESLPSRLHQELWRRSTYSIATACPSCSWLYIHMVALPWQLLHTLL